MDHINGNWIERLIHLSRAPYINRSVTVVNGLLFILCHKLCKFSNHDPAAVVRK